VAKKEELQKFKIKFGENLQNLRKKKKLSLMKMSYNCSLDESNISKIEHGKSNITLSTVIELAKALNVHPKKLLDFDFDFSEE
jgi:transcriptional regulator with XRE-family HTH domain